MRQAHDPPLLRSKSNSLDQLVGPVANPPRSKISRAARARALSHCSAILPHPSSPLPIMATCPARRCSDGLRIVVLMLSNKLADRKPRASERGHRGDPERRRKSFGGASTCSSAAADRITQNSSLNSPSLVALQPVAKQRFQP